jgi:hypothetical protein
VKVSVSPPNFSSVGFFIEKIKATVNLFVVIIQVLKKALV